MTLTVERTSPTTLALTRRFAAPPEAIWDAHMDPSLIHRWLCGDGGTTLSVCESDPQVGAAVRYEWLETDGYRFFLTGNFEAVEPPGPGGAGRSVHAEVMHLPDPTPPNRIETRFVPEGTDTRLELTMTLPQAADMDALLASGMTDGMEGCYAKLDGISVPQ